MTTTTEKIATITASLPEELRESFESHLLADAEDLADALEAEAAERYRKTMIGVEQIKNGEYLTREEWEEHSARFMAGLEEKYRVS